MPKSIPPQELDQLVELISLHHEGVGIDALLQAIGDNMPRRTLQRRLALLIEQGRVKPAEKAVHCATSAPRGSSKHQPKSKQMLRIRHRPKFMYLRHRRAKRLKLMSANLVSYVLQSAIS